MFQYYLFLLGCLIGINGIAQSFNFDIPEEQKPYYEAVYKYDEERTKGIKTQIRTRTTYSPSGEKTDTLKIFEFNKNGQITKKIFFKDNIRDGVKHFVYNNSLLKSTHYKTTNHTGRTFDYVYDKHGNNTELLERNFRGEDTTMFKLKRMEYDVNGNLIKKELFIGMSRSHLPKALNQTAEFQYNTKNQLVHHKHSTPSSVIYPTSEYYYTNNLDSINRFYEHIKDNTYTQYDYCKYMYNSNGQLTYKEEHDKSEALSPDASKRIHTYTYNENGNLIQAQYLSDNTLCVEAEYLYENNQIKEVIAKNHTPSRSSHIYFFYPSSTKEGKRLFKRDKKGYLVEEHVYNDNVLTKTLTNHNMYYD